MFADTPRSRIAREFFYTLNAMKDHYRALLHMEEDHPVSVGSMLVLMAIYMLREEGKKYIRPLDIVEHTMLPKSSVYRIMNDLTDAAVLQNNVGEYICAARTPDFLLNPTELYNKPITQVRETDYEAQEKIDRALEQMEQKTRKIILEEMSKQNTAPQGYGGIEDMKQQAKEMPMSPIIMRDQNIPPLGEANPFKKKKGVPDPLDEDINEEDNNEIEEDMKDFFL